MELITEDQSRVLLANGTANSALRNAGLDEQEFSPVIKLFAPWGAGTWLLSELDPEDADIAFGLCDLGMGCPNLVVSVFKN
jgi:hypothetical protein